MPVRDYLQELVDLRPGEHVLGLFDSEAEQRAWVTPFLAEGLRRGEKVCYLFDTRTPEQISGYLREAGLEPAGYLLTGQLSFTDAHAALIADDCFDPDLAVARLAADTLAAVDEGYTALRWTAEMTWVLRAEEGCGRYLEYECKSNAFLPDSLCLVLCQYDLPRFTPNQLLEVLALHPQIVSAEGRHENLFFSDPLHMSAEDPCRELLHGRLRRMQNWHRRLRATERERERIQHTLDAVSLPVAALDAEGTLLYLNAAAEAAFGCSLCSAHGRPGWELLATAEGQAALQGLLARAGQDGEAEGQLTARAEENGTPRTWSVRLRRAETGAPARHVILTCWPVEPVKA